MGLTKKGIQKTPIEVLPDAVVVKIASGSDHICCLTENSELFTLGKRPDLLCCSPEVIKSCYFVFHFSYFTFFFG